MHTNMINVFSLSTSSNRTTCFILGYVLTVTDGTLSHNLPFSPLPLPVVLCFSPHRLAYAFSLPSFFLFNSSLLWSDSVVLFLHDSTIFSYVTPCSCLLEFISRKHVWIMARCWFVFLVLFRTRPCFLSINLSSPAVTLTTTPIFVILLLQLLLLLLLLLSIGSGTESRGLAPVEPVGVRLVLLFSQCSLDSSLLIRIK